MAVDDGWWDGAALVLASVGCGGQQHSRRLLAVSHVHDLFTLIWFNSDDITVYVLMMLSL